jgi:hypothetical protein
VSFPRLLFALPQLPWDPASGAARTADAIAQLMVQADCCVKVIATTSSEGDQASDILQSLHPATTREAGILRIQSRGVSYELVDTSGVAVSNWAEDYGDLYDYLFDQALAHFHPTIVFTYGGLETDLARQKRAMIAGARVVFCLFNTRYWTRKAFDYVDAVVTPSLFLSKYYYDLIGLHTTVLTTPIIPEDAVATHREPICLTMVNPSLDKGVMVLLGLVQILSNRNPKIPFEVYLSRSNSYFLRRAGVLVGFDLLMQPNVVIHSSVRTPSLIYRRARVLLVPSLGQDAAPRVIAEAQVNGVVPVCSGRGGTGEMCAEGGFTITLPKHVDSRNLSVPTEESLSPWCDLIDLLMEDGAFYVHACDQARRAGRKYLPENVIESYVEFCERLMDGR